jgi:hypothetical protein
MKYRTQTVISPLTGSSYFGYFINQDIYMDGVGKEGKQLKANIPSQWSNSIIYTSAWHTVENKTTGTTSIGFKIYSNSGRDTTFNYTMAVDPAYAVIKNFTVDKDTETSVKFNFTTDSICDYAWYSKDNGASWFDLPVSNIVSGLTPNTTYNFKLRVRRKDNQLITTSNTVTQTTYNYPYCTSMNNFVIGNALTLNFYNPLGRNITATILGDDNSSIGSWSGTNIVAIGFNDSNSIAQQYASIPNKKSALYKVRVVYGSSTITTNGGTYSINEVACKPSITNATYQDTNSTTTAITGNNQQIIRNHSIVQYNASGLTVKNSATISSCSVSINSNSYNLTVSGTSASGGNAVIDSASNLTATFTLTDSRGLTATKDITINMLDWVLPTAIITAQRQANYYSETDINVDALYSSIDSKNTITIKYRAKKVSDTSWSSWTTIQNNVTTTATLDNLYEWNIQVLVQDLFGSTTYNLTIGIGLPIMYIDRLLRSVGFNCFPKNEKSFEINGSGNTRYCGQASGSNKTISTISSFQTVNFDAYNLKSSNTIQSNNGSLKILKAGTYKITLNVRWSDMTGGTTNNCYTGVSINGVAEDNILTGVFQPNMKRLTVNCSFILDLAVNDTIQLQVLTDTATSIKNFIMFVEALNVEVD